MDGIKSWSTVAFCGACLCSPALGQVTQRVSVDSNGQQGNAESGDYGISISADGRFVAFESAATNLVPGDTNGFGDVFVRDRRLGTTELVNVSSSGVHGDGPAQFPAISADGRYVAFESYSTHLVPGFPGNLFRRDRVMGTTEGVSLVAPGISGRAGGHGPSISADGRFVAFWSFSNNLVPGDTNGHSDVFVRDCLNGTTERVSVDSAGVGGNDDSTECSISADGRYVAFQSVASNFVPGDVPYSRDVFVYDRATLTIERVSVDSNGTPADGQCYSPSISGDGRFVAFWTSAGNLVPGDTNGHYDVFVHDRQSGATVRASVSSAGVQGDGDSRYPSMSADGRYVAFASEANNLVPGDTFLEDIFVRDLRGGTTERMSVTSGGAHATSHSLRSAISPNARAVAFTSYADNFAPHDTNTCLDVFVHDRFGGPTFTSLCEPGVGGVIACPCSNPASGPGRGCDNSASTGGAVLSASGGAFLSSDSLAFRTSGERSTALSVLIQGSASQPAGLAYGQGVMCVQGSLLRMYTKTALGGSITAPHIGSSDLVVSERSAALGDSIQPGQSRWYFVYYRDPLVLGSCSASSTFNATQTGQVTWLP
jgi:Tol biopolymer transport system component